MAEFLIYNYIDKKNFLTFALNSDNAPISKILINNIGECDYIMNLIIDIRRNNILEYLLQEDIIDKNKALYYAVMLDNRVA